MENDNVDSTQFMLDEYRYAIGGINRDSIVNKYPNPLVYLFLFRLKVLHVSTIYSLYYPIIPDNFMTKEYQYVIYRTNKAPNPTAFVFLFALLLTADVPRRLGDRTYYSYDDAMVLQKINRRIIEYYEK